MLPLPGSLTPYSSSYAGAEASLWWGEARGVELASLRPTEMPTSLLHCLLSVSSTADPSLPQSVSPNYSSLSHFRRNLAGAVPGHHIVCIGVWWNHSYIKLIHLYRPCLPCSYRLSLDVLCLMLRQWYNSSGRSHSHVGPFLHTGGLEML
jgi:hypothetical protein